MEVKKATAAYDAIVKVLEKNGFKKDKAGGMYRDSTGCYFDFNSLIKYESVLDFQLDWHYA